jgi:hypothetical protein
MPQTHATPPLGGRPYFGQVAEAANNTRQAAFDKAVPVNSKCGASRRWRLDFGVGMAAQARGVDPDEKIIGSNRQQISGPYFTNDARFSGDLSHDLALDGEFHAHGRGYQITMFRFRVTQSMRVRVTGHARNASSKRVVTRLHRISLGSYKPRQLGSLHIESCRRSTSKPSVLGTDQTISEIGSRILPDEKSLFDGRLILESNIGSIEQARDGFNDQILRQAVSATQHPFGFQENQLTYENAASCRDFTLDQLSCLLKLSFVVPNEKSNENIGIDPQHHRDNFSTGTGLRPFLCKTPASPVTLLVFTRMTTVASGINVNVIRSPAFMERLSRISLGIVV